MDSMDFTIYAGSADLPIGAIRWMCAGSQGEAEAFSEGTRDRFHAFIFGNVDADTVVYSHTFNMANAQSEPPFS